jgi:hypothetical protein
LFHVRTRSLPHRATSAKVTGAPFNVTNTDDHAHREVGIQVERADVEALIKHGNLDEIKKKK